MAARARSRDTAPKPKSDAYVGLLLLALLAQIAGAVFLGLEYYSYPDKAPPTVQDRPVTPPVAAPPVGGQPPVQ